jgi:hypothetical protein
MKMEAAFNRRMRKTARTVVWEGAGAQSPAPDPISLSLSIQINGQPSGGPVITNFTVPTSPPPPRSGYVGIAPSHQYFQTGDGQPLRLIGENVAWGE